jgi:ubiquinone/menaquinone biosynthesis C-methylase UbiE
MRLNLGCGYYNRQKGEIGFDYNIACKPQVCGDAQDLPFKDESFDEIYSCHVLEHIPNIVKTMNECWRILKKDGYFHIRTPLFPTIGSIADPTHVRFFIPRSFDYFTQQGKLTGLKNVFRMGKMEIRDLTDDTQEISCTMVK